MRYLSILLLIVVSFISCEHSELKADLKKEGDLIFTYGDGKNKNELNTVTGKFTKDMVKGDPIKFKLKLSAKQLDTIVAKAKEIDLENYPENQILNTDEALMAQIPCSTFSITMELNGKIKTVNWDDCRVPVSQKEQFNKLNELIKVITTMIYNTREYKASPPPRAMYL